MFHDALKVPLIVKAITLFIKQGFVQDFELREGGQDGSTCSRTPKRVCVLGGSRGMPPRKILNLDPLRLLLTKSGTRLLFNTCDKTIITILNSGEGRGGGNCGWRGKIPGPSV